MATGQYQRKWRARHSTVVNRHRLYCWGGQQEDHPMVHYNDEKRKFTSSVDIFHLPTLKWERRSTTATPPAGVIDYACTNLRSDNIMYFGGRCQPADCYHNDLVELNTLTNEWREIINSSSDNGPMRKSACGMISFNINAEDNLLVIGGFGPTPITGSQYIPHPNLPNRCYTNEIHTVCVNSSPGQWKVPIITGNRPPPCAHFSIYTLPGNRGVMFGGATIDETGLHRVNDLFLLSISQNTIDFQKVVKTSNTTLKWPKARDGHASTIINTISSNQQTISHLMVLGGLAANLQTLNDCWIMNLSSFIWYQINLPDSVTKRFHHSMSTYYISKERFWIVVTGGFGEYIRSDNTGLQITRSNITVIIELEYIYEEWSVKHVWNNEQLMKDKNEIQKSLIHHIVDDRLQEGTLVTDLIDSIKSSSSTPHQLETQRLIEQKIFDQFSDDRLHQQKQLQIAQQELQMLQKDAGKKLHDNEIEIRRQSLELMGEKKRCTDLESELLSVQGIADNRSTSIYQLRHELEVISKEYMKNVHQYQMKIQEVNKQLENMKKLDQRKEEELLQVNLDLRGKDEAIKEMKTKEISLQHKVDKLKQDWELKPSAKELDISHKHQQLSLLNNKLERSKEKIKLLESNVTKLNQTTEKWKKDCEIAQHEHQKLNDELQHNQQKVKHLQSNITKLYQTAEIWKKYNYDEIHRIAVPEKSELEEFEQMTHTDQPLEELKCLWSDIVNETQALKTELRKKEELITQIENENKQVVALQRELQEEKPNMIDYESPDVQEFQETKMYKDKEVQVNYLVHLTDRVSSVHVAAQKQFLIQGSKCQVIDWEQFGFKMQFPQGTLHQSVTCEVAVKALVGGMFQFPQDTQLVSATYAISFADELLQPVTLEIQHCVILKSKEQFKYLSFMIAQIDESAPPYKFQLVKGGKFNIDNQYGTITRQKFCLVGIGKTFNDDSSDDTSSEENDPPSDDDTSSDNEQNPPNNESNTTSGNETHTNDQTNTTSDNETHTDDQTNGSDSGSVHEDTTAVHYDIEHTDVNDATLTTPTEQDKEVVFETHQNDDKSPSVGSDNEIKMKYPYPSLDLLYEFDRRFQDMYSTNNVSCNETSFDSETQEDKYTHTEHVMNISQDNNTGLNKVTQSELDDDPEVDHKLSSPALNAKGKCLELSDNEIPVSDISDIFTHHSISKGVTDRVPDNMYTGVMYYKRIGSNKWLMMFMVVQNIKVFLEFISAKHPTAIEDQIIRFSFKNSKTGYIELLLNNSDICHGWNIDPHMEPLKLMKSDADRFGPNDLPIPPSCLIAVWADLSCKPNKIRLRHPLSLTGIHCNTKKIYIIRFLETVDATITRDFITSQATVNTSHTDLVHFDITKLRNLIVSKINDNYAGLHRLVETSLPNFTIEMFQARLISEGIRDKSTPDNILKEFINGMDWIHNHLDMEEHCKKFLEVCNKIGGSCIPASKTLKYQWIESVKQEMCVSLSLEY